MWTRGFRDEIWSRLDQPWDLVVVGGGITGAGILGEAVRQGRRALLVEAQDFASGTSSRSTKLVHEGLDQVARIRSLTQSELGWDGARWDAEEAAYRSSWKQSYAPLTRAQLRERHGNRS